MWSFIIISLFYKFLPVNTIHKAFQAWTQILLSTFPFRSIKRNSLSIARKRWRRILLFRSKPFSLLALINTSKLASFSNSSSSLVKGATTVYLLYWFCQLLLNIRTGRILFCSFSLFRLKSASQISPCLGIFSLINLLYSVSYYFVSNFVLFF